MNLPRCLFSY